MHDGEEDVDEGAAGKEGVDEPEAGAEEEAALADDAEDGVVGEGEPKIVALELGEGVGGESFRAELSLDRVGEVVAERTKIRDMNAFPEKREQGAGVGGGGTSAARSIRGSGTSRRRSAGAR